MTRRGPLGRLRPHHQVRRAGQAPEGASPHCLHGGRGRRLVTAGRAEKLQPWSVKGCPWRARPVGAECPTHAPPAGTASTGWCRPFRLGPHPASPLGVRPRARPFCAGQCGRAAGPMQRSPHTAAPERRACPPTPPQASRPAETCPPASRARPAPVHPLSERTGYIVRSARPVLRPRVSGSTDQRTPDRRLRPVPTHWPTCGDHAARFTPRFGGAAQDLQAGTSSGCSYRRKRPPAPPRL